VQTHRKAVVEQGGNTVTQIYTYRVGVFTPKKQVPDLTGYDVEATDGSIGEIDEATYDQNASCVVVDTGFWIFGKKRMIPAGVVQRVELDNKKVYVNMTKDQIKSAPDYDADRHHRNDDAYRDEVGNYYEGIPS
jgi:hypothetical protein